MHAQPPPPYGQNVPVAAVQGSLFAGRLAGQSLADPPPQDHMFPPGPGGFVQLQRVSPNAQLKPSTAHWVPEVGAASGQLAQAHSDAPPPPVRLQAHWFAPKLQVIPVSVQASPFAGCAPGHAAQVQPSPPPGPPPVNSHEHAVPP